MARVFEAVFERVAGLDVHKAQVTACIRVADAEGKRVDPRAQKSSLLAREHDPAGCLRTVPVVVS